MKIVPKNKTELKLFSLNSIETQLEGRKRKWIFFVVVEKKGYYALRRHLNRTILRRANLFKTDNPTKKLIGQFDFRTNEKKSFSAREYFLKHGIFNEL